MLKLGYKLGHYAGIMLDALTMPLCPKLCRHNVSNPITQEFKRFIEKAIITGLH